MNSVRVKICGLRRKDDALLALELGAWGLGFIFYEKSPRCVSASEVKAILSACDEWVQFYARKEPLKKVGVFVNPSLSQLRDAVNEAGINVIQLHGQETEKFCSEVKRSYSELEIIKVVRLNDLPTGTEKSFDYQLVDSFTSTALGGTGQVVDWDEAKKIKGLPVILAGGLTPENVALAIETVNPFAVDVSSGVEELPGVKSPEKLRRFFAAVSSAISDKGNES